jgi:hypothetical protein
VEAEREIQRVRNQAEAEYLRQLRSNSGLAFQLTAFQALTGDACDPCRNWYDPFATNTSR